MKNLAPAGDHSKLEEHRPYFSVQSSYGVFATDIQIYRYSLVYKELRAYRRPSIDIIGQKIGWKIDTVLRQQPPANGQQPETIPTSMEAISPCLWSKVYRSRRHNIFGPSSRI
ncbi:hypothetical protein KQX54_021377 [Cotesia glomerata]|uniref:Uncharacterized protein n=1 Tax=Cotesia glomerata TaxID=32391 RepID=A0AAV7J984_COTGL|nr:hypothetical protein KQX54_021377 [Cotesia glomerata]